MFYIQIITFSIQNSIVQFPEAYEYFKTKINPKVQGLLSVMLYDLRSDNNETPRKATGNTVLFLPGEITKIDCFTNRLNYGYRKQKKDFSCYSRTTVIE